MNERLLTVGIDRCHRAGLVTSRSSDAAKPPVIAHTAGDETAALSDESSNHDERPVIDARASEPPTPETLLSSGWSIAIETISEVDPTVVLSRVWNNQSHNRATLFVTPTQQATAKITNILTAPVGVVDSTNDGRQFYPGPDRIPLAEGGYAAVPTSAPLSWNESRTASGQPGLVATISDDAPAITSEEDGRKTTEQDDVEIDQRKTAKSGSTDEKTSRKPTTEQEGKENITTDVNPSMEPSRSNDTTPDMNSGVNISTNRPWLELRAGDEVLVRLNNVDALACPPRERFPYAYHRDDDKQIRVLDFAGRPVERYGGITDMRHNGFQPVPAPLVPEHMFNKSITGWWGVLTAQQ